MVNNTKEKSLTVIKDRNILTKVLSFFRSIFNRNKQTPITIEETNYSNQIIQKQNTFALSDIEIKFRNFREGNIRESDLTQDEIEQLKEIFRERIQKEQEEIDYLKVKILKIRSEYLRAN